jgi:hypothetical protein
VTFEESLSGQADHKVLNVVSIQVSVMWDIAVQEELNVPHSVAVLWKETLRETQALPSVNGFAEGLLSGPRQS